jgi:perosamine synthetase
MQIPLSMPSIGSMERTFVDDAIESGWLSGTGPYVTAFEAALTDRLERPHVVAVSSGTSALEVALLGLGIGPGDEVIVPALTFAAPAAAVRSVGAEVVLCDVTPETWTINPAEAGMLISDRTKAIIGVDVMGHPCDFDALLELGVPIIEDAAEAHGSRYKDRQTGTFGVAAIFSFHANKCITTGEGGCIATSDAGLADRLRVISNHGMRPERPYYHEVAGRSVRMSNLCAAVGLAQVKRWPELTANRILAGELYAEALSDIGYAGRPIAGWASVVPWLQVVILPRNRERILEVMRGHGIDARAIWPALSDLDLYKSSVTRPCPVATEIAATAAWLPTWSHMGRDVITEVVSELSAAIDSVARGSVSRESVARDSVSRSEADAL